MLFRAHDAGQLIGVRCNLCAGRKRYYLPIDLIRLFGDLSIAEAAQRMKCEKCGHHDYLRAEIVNASAAERQAIKVRRLVGVKMRKVPVWREDI